jgi:hypothetical protein
LKTPAHIKVAGLDVRVSDLLALPQQEFAAQLTQLGEFLLSEESAGDADAASAFLHVLCARGRSKPASVAAIYEKLLPAIAFVAGSQQRFGADKHEYGDFKERAAELAALFHRDPEELTGESQMLDASDDA